MHLGLTPDQELFQEATRKFLDAEASPARLRELASSPAGYEPAYWRQAAELGWTSLLVPEESGGGSIGGNGLVDLSLVAVEMGRHAAPGPLTGSALAAAILGRRPGTDAAEGWLGGLLSGELTAAWAPLGEDLVEGGADADLLLVSESGPSGSLCAVVPADGPGIRVDRLTSLDLTRRWGRVRLGGLPDGADLSPIPLLETALCLQLAEMVGAMEAVFEMTRQWTFSRYSFGRPLASYQEIKHRMADMRMWLEASAAITMAAVEAVGAGRADGPELVSAAKAYVGHHGPELVQDCVQIHGGIGVTFDHDLHLYLRRVTAAVPLYGSPAQHRARLGALVAERAGAAS